MSTQNPDGGAQHWAVTLAPLAAILVVVLTHFNFYRNFLSCPEVPARGEQCIRFDPGPLLKGVKTAFTSDAAVYVGGAMWTLVCGLHVLVSLAALIASIYVLRGGLGARPEGWRGWLIVALAVAWAAFIASLSTIWLTGERSAPAPWLLSQTVGRMLPRINIYNRLFDALGLTVGVMLAAAACAAIRRDEGPDPDGAALAGRMRLLRTLLFVGAAALVVSVVRLSVTLNWGGSFLPAAETPEGKNASTLITGIVSALGVYYTLLLAAVYVPAALVLRGRAYSLAVAQEPAPEKRGEWLKARGLALTLPEYLPRILAILSPILVGPVADLIKGVLNLGGK